MLPHVTAGLSQATLRRIELASGELAATCLAEMERRQPWFGRLPADQRAGVLLVTQTGVANFVAWLGERGRVDPAHRGGVPHRPARPGPAAVAAPDRGPRAHRHRRLRAAACRRSPPTSRSGTPCRGHPALRPGDRLRGRDGLRGRRRDPRRLGRPPGGAGRRRRRPRARPTTRSSPGPRRWAGTPRPARGSSSAARASGPREGPGRAAPRGGPRRPFRARRRAGQQAGRAGVGARPAATAVFPERLALGFGPGPVVVGPVGPDLRGGARQRPRRARPGCAPPRLARGPPARRGRRPPARAGAGGRRRGRAPGSSRSSRRSRGRAELRRTLEVYVEGGGALEACARALFVHPNTVRYRLRRVGEITGLAPTDPRDALVLRTAVIVGRLDDH